MIVGIKSGGTGSKGVARKYIYKNGVIDEDLVGKLVAYNDGMGVGYGSVYVTFGATYIYIRSPNVSNGGIRSTKSIDCSKYKKLFIRLNVIQGGTNASTTIKCCGSTLVIPNINKDRSVYYGMELGANSSILDILCNYYGGGADLTERRIYIHEIWLEE